MRELKAELRQLAQEQHQQEKRLIFYNKTQNRDRRANASKF
jgi:hypothetical protein